MKLDLYDLGSPGPDIRPAPASRAWMDATPNGFANRCLPLRIANAHGWELLCRADCEASWTGGVEKSSLRVLGNGKDELRCLPTSHFGSGVLTFHVDCLFRTTQGYGLWCGGPVNLPKHGIQPLCGLIETDELAFTFTMNWLFTAPGTVAFRKGEPFCHLFPLPMALAESTQVARAPISANPRLEARFKQQAAARLAFNAGLADPASEATRAGWQKDYMRGRHPDGRAFRAHRTRLKLRRFP